MKEAIILAGGLGTRLQTVVSDRPKCMAIIANKPFLEYLLDYLAQNKFDHVILSLGFKSEIVVEWLNSINYPYKISVTIEKEPLGTGGAIKYASMKSESDHFFVFNGDTYFDVDIEKMTNFHRKHEAQLTLALKPMTDFDRYGCVILNSENRVVAFKEKKFTAKGLINGGIYLISKKIFQNDYPNKFSFEKDILENQIKSINIMGYIEDSYFIDIGIPSDYDKANIDFSNL